MSKQVKNKQHMKRCVGITRSGKRCKKKNGNGVCHLHAIKLKPLVCEEVEGIEPDVPVNQLSDYDNRLLFAIFENLNKLKPWLKKHYKIENPVIAYGLSDAEPNVDVDDYGQGIMSGFDAKHTLKKVAYPHIDDFKICDVVVAHISDEETSKSVNLLDFYDVTDKFVAFKKLLAPLIVEK